VIRLWHRLILSFGHVASASPLYVSKLARAFLSRPPDTVETIPVVRKQLTEVVLAYIDLCDEDAERAGMEWMRERYRARGETPRF
jgi:hypothetical protein